MSIGVSAGPESRRDATLRSDLADPAGLLERPGPDRAIVSFREGSDVEAKRGAFVKIVRQ